MVVKSFKKKHKHIVDVNNKKTLKNFLKMKSQNKPLMIWYHADWCGHCRNMDNEWDRFVTQRKKNNSVNLAKIESNFIGEEEGIRGYPTIRLLNIHNTPLEFERERTKDNFEHFLNEHVSNQNNIVGGGIKSNKKSQKKRSSKRRSNRKRSNKKQRGGRSILDTVEDKMQILENMMGNYNFEK